MEKEDNKKSSKTAKRFPSTKTGNITSGLRAFIGPIGDDIPSLFPIVSGIFIFLLSIAFIQVQVADRNSYLDVRKATLEVSYLATDKGFMSPAEFDAKCGDLKDFAQKNQVNFALVLKNYCSQGQEQVEFGREGTFGSDENLVVRGPEFGDKVCSNNATIENWPSTHPGTRLQVGERDTVIMTYPISVYCNQEQSLRGLGLLNVVGWRRR